MVYEAFSNTKRKSKNTIYIFAGDFNIPDVNWTCNSVDGTTDCPLRVTQTILDIAVDSNLAQLVDFPTSQEITLDLVFTSHQTFKIKCRP